MNFITGVLNRQTIMQQSQTRLVIRELPLAEWLFAAVIAIIGVNLAIVSLWVTAVAALVIALVVVLRASVRYLTFDLAADTLTITQQSPLSSETVNTFELQRLQRAYLLRGEGGATQIILVDVLGKEMGLSVYSQDVNDWKEEVVLVINNFLHEYRQQKDDADAGSPASL